MSRVYLELLNEDHFDDEYVGWHSQDHTDFYSGSKRIFTRENLLEEFSKSSVLIKAILRSTYLRLTNLNSTKKTDLKNLFGG